MLKRKGFFLYLIILFFLSSTTIFSETTVRGIVSPHPARVEVYQAEKLLSRVITDEEGNFEFKLQEGKYKIILSHGFEFKPYILEVDTLSFRQTPEVMKITLERICNMKELGWVSGDSHLHSKFSDGKQFFPELVRAARSEGLNWLCPTEHNDGAIKCYQHLYKHKFYSGDDFITFLGEEVGPNALGWGYGHFNAIGIEGFVPGYYPNKFNAREIINATHKYKGLVLINHPFDDIAPKNTSGSYFWCLENTDIPQELGFDGMEGFDSEEALRYWYKLLDEGRKLFLIGNTDSHDVYGTPLGSKRTYIYLGENKLSKENILSSLKSMKAFCTSGPLLQFTVNGKMLGEELIIKKGEKINISLNIKSIFELRKYQIIKNGFPSYEKEISGNSYQENFSLPVYKSCYLILRVWTVDGKQAITNPIWVKIK